MRRGSCEIGISLGRRVLVSTSPKREGGGIHGPIARAGQANSERSESVQEGQKAKDIDAILGNINKLEKDEKVKVRRGNLTPSTDEEVGERGRARS